MATWTPLTTTYTTNTVINVSTWNALTGSSGNLQYLYEQLIPEMYVNGYENTSFVFTENNTQYGLSLDTYNDIRPSNLSQQVIYSSFTGLFQSRKNGLYLISASTANSGLGFYASWSTPALTFVKNNNQISQSLLNYLPSTGAAAVAQQGANNLGIINHFAIELEMEGDEVYTTASKNAGTTMSVQSLPGNSSTGLNTFIKSPYVSNVFLNDPGQNVVPPTPIFILDPNTNLTLSGNFNPMITPSPNDKWASALGFPNSSTNFAFPDTQQTYTSNPLNWLKATASNDKVYVYPNVSASFPLSYATWRYSPQSTVVADYDCCFMMVVIKSFDQLTSGYTNYEQNLLSLHTIDRAGEIIGTPISVTAYTNNANTLTSIYLRVAQRQILIDEINPANIGNGYIFSLECGRLRGGIINYSSINCTTSLSGSRIIDSTAIGSLTSYSLSDIKIATMGGIEFFSISNTQANNKTTLSYYYVGNWRLSDMLQNPFIQSNGSGVVQYSGINYTQQKQLLWSIMKSEFNVSERVESISAGTNVNNAIVFDTFAFGNTTRFV